MSTLSFFIVIVVLITIAIVIIIVMQRHWHLGVQVRRGSQRDGPRCEGCNERGHTLADCPHRSDVSESQSEDEEGDATDGKDEAAEEEDDDEDEL